MTHETGSASLFGQVHSNRNYSDAASWGKNIFNSTFPASLLAYMSHRGIDPVYLRVDENLNVYHGNISPSELLGIDPLSADAYYCYETAFEPYDGFYTTSKRIEHIDLVMRKWSTGEPLSGLEIKLTTLPDSATWKKTEDKYSCELVVRLPTICYLACSICQHYDSPSGKQQLWSLLSGVPNIRHWNEHDSVAPHIAAIEAAVLEVAKNMVSNQQPLIVQPVWKVDINGALSEDCLDVFVWSNLALIRLFCGRENNRTQLSRYQRTAVWLYLMLFEFANYSRFDYSTITGYLASKDKNDKAFASNGSATYPFLRSEELLHPRVKKSEIKNVILGGGQFLLSPERRFDAVLVNSPDVFE